jgi:hypothetical protein
MRVRKYNHLAAPALTSMERELPRRTGLVRECLTQSHLSMPRNREQAASDILVLDFLMLP